MGLEDVKEVRQGKYFDIETNENDETKAKSKVEDMCKKLLANLVIEDYKIIHALRAHGWDRGLFKKNNRNFNFVNSGFNLRPLDLTVAIGLSQFKRLNKMNKIRSDNRNKIINPGIKII